jgi:hypothetical protein
MTSTIIEHHDPTLILAKEGGDQRQQRTEIDNENNSEYKNPESCIVKSVFNFKNTSKNMIDTK